ncbi:MAG: TIR domain-containing protein [Spirosoma sp.]|nr:TIR domain-containing protein [Spirosoma sp.]
MIVDVFLSRKSQDSHMALQLMNFLRNKGLEVFDSDELSKHGNSDYGKAIYEALDAAKHIIVIGSSVKHITSTWVESEWNFFINEKLAGRKSGNILTVVGGKISIKDLPPRLRSYQVIPFKSSNFEEIYNYVSVNKSPSQPAVIPPALPKKKVIHQPEFWLIVLGFFLIVSLIVYFKLHPEPATSAAIKHSNKVNPNIGNNEDKGDSNTIKLPLWKTGTTLNVQFLNGSASLKSAVEKTAIEWTKYGNIKFDFVTSGVGQIRIMFNEKQSYSYLVLLCQINHPALT